MNQTHRALALHGFLGTSRDWELVRRSMKAMAVETDWMTPELFLPGPCSAQNSFATWCESVLLEMESQFGREPIDLLGYSLGGRLAIHLALQAPQRFSRIWLYSTNPGVLFEPIDQRRRWESDWAERFRHGSWQETLKDWNHQVVFARSRLRVVDEPNAEARELLALSFTNWSLAAHHFHLEEIHRLQDPIHWWFGEFDEKFLRVKTELERQNIPGSMRVISDAGHRLPLDQPEPIAQALLN